MENIRDHNREEFSKAKKIALDKMENNDFCGGQQIILEAQKLCPELAENMSQMLIICNIHCAAESLVGGAKDLYRILQVKETADETMITKQFRRLALSIHPDKTEFVGAEEAFKLLSEAYSVLLDPAKRTEHNYRRKSGTVNVAKEAKKPSDKTDANKGSVSGSSSTIWTTCPHCESSFQYTNKVLYCRIVCQTCNKMFTAYRVEDQEVDWRRKNYSQDVAKEAHKKKPSYKTDVYKGSMSASSLTFWTKCKHCNFRNMYIKEALNSMVDCLVCNKKYMADHIEEPEEPMSTSADVGSDSENMLHEQQSSDSLAHENMFQEQQSSDDEDNIAIYDNMVSTEINIQDKRKGMCTSVEDNIVKETIDSAVLEMSSCCSDPSIKIRDINSIIYNDGAVDQIWALYDNIDHMPRSYAKIKFVGNTKCLYWLKYCPLSEEEKEWNNKCLPVACGKFCLGEKFNISEYSSLYSHTVEWKKIYVGKVSGRSGSAKNKLMVHEIYPKRGEVWALFKGWSKQWSSDGNNSRNRSYEYEVVEVLSDMSDKGGANVVPLIRIKGFPSLVVAAKDKSWFDIPSSEIFRFSHRIPHYRVSGDENNIKQINGPKLEKKHIVPEGFLLLNSSSLPSNLDATFPSMNLDAYMSQSKKRSREECQSEIFPQVGEIWAIYVDWAPEWSASSTDCCEFAVGEIIERNDASTKFGFLSKIDGFPAVFKPDKQKGVQEIPSGENLRFSHRIPASFRVMKQKGVKRRVFYDLDPAYLVTVQNHATSSGNGCTLEVPATKQKTAAAQVWPRRTARSTRPNSRYIGPQWQ